MTARRGWIEVVCGSMFSGKTEELIRRLNRAKIARQRVEIFKPALDTRYHALDVVSHNANSIRSTPIPLAQEMLLLASACDVVGVDEAQFFDESLVDVCVQLANAGTRVIVAGLDMDFLGKPFGPMPALMAVAEYVTKVHFSHYGRGKQDSARRNRLLRSPLPPVLSRGHARKKYRAYRGRGQALNWAAGRCRSRLIILNSSAHECFATRPPVDRHRYSVFPAAGGNFGSGSKHRRLRRLAAAFA
jgi:thymidine kinase